MHSSIGQNIKSFAVSGLHVRHHDCDVIHGPIFTKFGTQLPRTVHKKIFSPG